MSEVPAALVTTYQQKLPEHHGVTLEEVAHLYQILRGQYPIAQFAFPDDLRRAGLSIHPRDQWAILLYASLSPEQRAHVQQKTGVPFVEMTSPQQTLLQELPSRGESITENLAVASFTVKQTPALSPQQLTEYTFALTTPSGELASSKIAFLLSVKNDVAP